MIRDIEKNKYFTFTLVSLLSVFFIFLNFYLWHSTLAGILFFAIYLIINSIWLNRILSNVISIASPYCYLLPTYGLLILLAFAGAVFIVLWKITPAIMIGILSGLTLVISALNYFVLSLRGSPDPERSEGKGRPKPALRSHFGEGRQSRGHRYTDNLRIASSHTFKKKCGASPPLDFPEKVWWVLAMTVGGVFMFLCFLFLWKARTGDYILSPWTKIHPVYLYFWFFVTFLVGYLILVSFNSFDSKKASRWWRIVLSVIILHSILLHAYLPIVYKTGFGGDRWRHIAAERYLQQGKIYSPALFGEEVKWQKFGPLKIPSVFVVGNKTSYANQWALTIFLSWIFQRDVFWIDIFLLPILWSIFLPLFLFFLGQLLIRNLKLEIRNLSFPLLLAFLPALFYPFQVYGSATIPTGFGFLLFLFILLLLFNKQIAQISFRQKLLSIAGYLLLIIFLYFSYILYLILFLEISLMVFLFKKIHNKKLLVTSYLLLIICFLFLIPSLDTFYGLTQWKTEIFSQPGLILSSLGEFVKKLLGFESFVPQITQGNFIYSQTGKSLSSNTLLSLIGWPIIISSIIWLFVLYGVFALRKKASRLAGLLVIFLFITLGNQFISNYFMEGVHLLSKRLDLFIAFLMLPFLGLGLYKFVNTSSRLMTRKAKIILICLFLALASTSTYASGPKLEVVTEDELKAAQYVWQQLKPVTQDQSSITKYCVLANTWPLLALEAVSSREIVAGNFPVYQEYAQPERVKLFKGMSMRPSRRYMEKALEITGASSCYFMTEERFWNKRDPSILEKLEEIFGGYKKIGEVYIFYFQKSF